MELQLSEEGWSQGSLTISERAGGQKGLGVRSRNEAFSQEDTGERDA